MRGLTGTAGRFVLLAMAGANALRSLSVAAGMWVVA